MAPRLRRRQFLAAGAAAAACRPAAPSTPAEVTPPGGSDDNEGPSPFAHGVASGDPLPDAIILWTRVTPPSVGAEVEVRWQLADTREFRTIVAQGRTTATADRDHTVKVDVGELSPGRTYHYRFEALGQRSPIGRTRTAPAGPTPAARFAVVSCSNYPFGYFNVYAAIAGRDDLDAVLHLGDYLYEYANGQYGDGTELGRLPDPPDREMVALADYRARHAIYKTDPDLQALHRQHPMIAVWDDHELTNDAWTGGAQNHQPEEEGDWPTRRAAALRAYREWMPIRERAGDTLSLVVHRSLRYGDLLDLVMLDTRLVGRDQQPDWKNDDDWEKVARDPARSLLGAAQEQWLARTLEQSRDDGIAWRVLGQQTLMAQLRPRSLGDWLNMDMWDGYVGARERLLGHLSSAQIDDVIVLTGDIHSSWAFELSADPWSDRAPVAVELVTPAVSSPPPVPPEHAAERESGMPKDHPHLRYVELRRRGFLLLDLDHDRAVARWLYIADVATRSAAVDLGHGLAIERGTPRLIPAPPDKSPFAG